MKKAAILFILLTACSFLFSQNIQLSWQQCFGGSEPENVYDIIAIENSYYIIGGTSSNDGNIYFNHGMGDGWLIKTDQTGGMLWEKTYGGSNGEHFKRIISDENNNIYLLGQSNSSDGDISSDPYPGSGDYWIVKIDTSGEIIWDKIVGGNAGETLWTGILTDDGGIVATGWSASDDGDVSVHYGYYDTWMVKLSSEGELEWDFTIGADLQDYGQAIIQTSDGGYLAASNSMIGEGGNISCVPHSYMAEAVLTKLDADRNIQWQHCYGGSDHDGALALLELDDGYLFSAYGGSADGDLTGSGWHGEDDVWVVKIDSVGNIIWQKCFGGSNDEHGYNIFNTSNDGYIIAGRTISQDGDVVGNHSLSEYDNDIWLINISGEGELLWQKCFGGLGDEYIYNGIVKKSDNDYVIAAQTDYGPSYDVACTPHGGNGIDIDFWVFEIKDTSTNIVEDIIDKSGVKVYPNPSKDYVIFEMSLPLISPQGGKRNVITILNVFGEEVETLNVKPGNAVWDTREVRSGIYFYKAEINGKPVTGKVVVQK